MKKFDENAFFGEGETLIYAGEPTKKSYPVFQIIMFFIAFIGVTVADGFLVGASVFKSVAGENLVGEIVLYASAFLLHVIPLCFWGFNLLVRIFLTKNTRYVITDERASIVRIAEKTVAETVFFSDVDDIKIKNNDLILVIKEEFFVLKNLENSRALFEEIKDKIAK